MRQHNVTFANFICRFGEKKTLLDYVEEIVLPAFTDNTLVRKRGGKSEYRFYDVQKVILENNENTPIIGITGQFIKDTTLTREQVLHPEKGLIKDGRSMASTPSAYFILILNNHRLIYFPETAHAPDLKAFKSTALTFIQKKRNVFITSLIRKSKKDEADSASLRKLINENNPSPTLEVIPLASEESIDTFLDRYGILKYFEMKLITPNDEINAGKLFNSLKDSLIDAGAENTKVVSRSKDGFKTKKVAKILKSAAKTGNEDFVLKGVDESGNELIGDAESFKINIEIPRVPLGREALTQKLYSTFQDLIASGAIAIGVMADKSETIRRIAESFKGHG